MRTRLILSVAVCLLATAVQIWASDDKNAAAPLSAEDLKQLRERIAQDEEQIKRLQQSLEEQRTLLDRATASMEGDGGSPETPLGTPVRGSDSARCKCRTSERLGDAAP